MSKASSNFSSEEHQERFRIKRGGVSSNPPYGGVLDELSSWSGNVSTHGLDSSSCTALELERPKRTALIHSRYALRNNLSKVIP